VANILSALLKDADVRALPIRTRVKDVDSLVEKVRRKNYRDLDKQVTDLAGVRVIVYRLRDLDRVCQVVQESFNLHPETRDKRVDLGVDKVGYRSMNFVCDLGPSRAGLREYTQLMGRVFELQVCTVLEHAWAEIEHDIYKSEGLPNDLGRPLKLLAGQLESADWQLEIIIERINAYKAKVKVEATEAARAKDDLGKAERTVIEFLGSPIDAISIQNVTEGLSVGMPNVTLWSVNPSPQDRQQLLDELRRFKIETNGQLHQIVADLYFSEVGETTWIGIVRDAMMMRDLERYFREAWQESWFVGDDPEGETELRSLLLKRYTAEQVATAFARLRGQAS
jgi:ppGpp synthetase/RelA/SpoT-type nucleotidyltranferase